ncbi:MAG: helix-turn-helix transcriptional regulator [Saccharospirillaceae bacterium]|nr:helix-turn-helix domain-containing protein [Pseudomonadales bacterium]NRB81199.1 helix-turn-helix transcriptional regulator [Saccharospirillaceae bacterium]
MLVNAQKIKAHRIKLDWTQQQLADACGVSMRTIQRVERYGKASNETSMALAAVFEVDKQSIIEEQTPIKVIEVNQFKALHIIPLCFAVIFGMVLGAMVMNMLKT